MNKAKIVNLSDLEKDFSNKGYDPKKIWLLEEKDKKLIIQKYTLCYQQTVSNRRFIEQVYLKVCNEKKIIFFNWLATTKYARLLK